MVWFKQTQLTTVKKKREKKKLAESLKICRSSRADLGQSVTCTVQIGVTQRTLEYSCL